MTLPLNRFLVRIDVPQAVGREREILDLDEARERVPTWDAIPSAAESARFGTTWCRSMRSALLCVPSVIIPEEQVMLINPGLITGNGIRAQVVRRFDYAATALLVSFVSGALGTIESGPGPIYSSTYDRSPHRAGALDGPTGERKRP